MTTFRSTVRVRLQGTDRPLPHVRVALYDRDRYSADDLLGTARTDIRGRAEFSYALRDFADNGPTDDPEPGPRGRRERDVLPDLYVGVHDESGRPVFTTRAQTIENTPRRRIEVEIPERLATARGLVTRKPRTGEAELMVDLERRLRSLVAAEGPAGLCLLTLALETLGGVDDPKTDLQKAAAQRVKKETDLKPELVTKVSAAARSGVDAVMKTQWGQQLQCPPDVDGIVKMMVQGGGSASALQKALQVSVPAPDADLDSPAAGAAFKTTWVWPEKHACVLAYEQGEVNDPVALEQMDNYFPHGIEIMHPPSVNKIDIWDDVDYGTGQYLREAFVPSRRLVFRTIDLTDGTTGWRESELLTAVSLDDPQCLIAKADADDNQILAVDVRPGQKVALRGSGFISAQARLRVLHIPWTTEAIDASGVLVPNEGAAAPLAGWDDVVIDVHGSSETPTAVDTAVTYDRDLIVFDWPDLADGPGLYRMTLEFENPGGSTVRVTVDPTTCRLDFDTRAITDELWFAVLPDLQRRRLNVLASELECVALGPPGWWFDDVTCMATGRVERAQVDPQGVTFETIVASNTVTGQRVFFGPETWPPAPPLQPVPSDDSPPTMRETDIAFLHTSVMEVFGPAEKAIAAVLGALLTIVLVVIFAAVLIALVFLLVAVTTLTLGTGGAALIVAIIAVSGTLIVVGAPLMGAVVMSLAESLGGITDLGQVTTAVQGTEYAHLISPVRYHRMLWTLARPSSGGTLLHSSALGATLKERFRLQRNGGEYQLELTMRP